MWEEEKMANELEKQTNNRLKGRKEEQRCYTTILGSRKDGPHFFITCKLNGNSGFCFTAIMDFIRKQSEPFKIKWFFLLTHLLSSKIRFRFFYSSHFVVSFVEYFNVSLSADRHSRAFGCRWKIYVMTLKRANEIVPSSIQWMRE